MIDLKFDKTGVLKLLCLCIMATTIVFQTSCTTSQQNRIYQKALDIARTKANLSIEQKRIMDIDMAYLNRNGSGPTVLFVHGFSANKDSWLRLIDYLPSSYQVIAPDLAGHGDSSSEAAMGYGLFSQAERLKQLLDTLEIDKVHIVGNSMGG